MLDAMHCFETTLAMFDNRIREGIDTEGGCDGIVIRDMLELADFHTKCQEPLERYLGALQTPSSIVNHAKQQQIVQMYSEQLVQICILHGLTVPTDALGQKTEAASQSVIALAGHCSNCMTPFTIEPCCTNCGTQLDSASTHYHTRSTNVDKKSTLSSTDTRDHRGVLKQRRAHFRAFLIQFQGRGPRVVPTKVLEYVQTRLKESHLLIHNRDDMYANINRSHIAAILRSAKHSNMNKYYKDVTRIHAMITGQKPPDLSHLETRLTLMFDIGFFFCCCNSLRRVPNSILFEHFYPLLDKERPDFDIRKQGTHGKTDKYLLFCVVLHEPRREHPTL